MEGSFDNDVLIGDGRANSILGQPGDDRFYGNGGEDVHRRPRRRPRRRRPVRARRSATISGRRDPGPAATATAFVDPFDPAPVGCAEVIFGHPVPGLGKTGEHHPSR